jgi:hypothetical protein
MGAWIATLLTLARLDRTPRSYVFMFAGYTAAIAGFPSVTAPGDIFTVAHARTEEIGLGVVCAALVSTLVFPVHIRSLLLARMKSWLHKGESPAARALSGEPLSLSAEADRRPLAADVADIGVLAPQLPFDRAGAADLAGRRPHAPRAASVASASVLLGRFTPGRPARRRRPAVRPTTRAHDLTAGGRRLAGV